MPEVSRVLQEIGPMVEEVRVYFFLSEMAFRWAEGSGHFVSAEASQDIHVRFS